MPSLIDMIINSNRISKKNNKSGNKHNKISKNTKKNNMPKGTNKKEVVDDFYDRYIKRYFGDVRIDNKRLDTKSKKSKSFEWGIGAEHEMHLFHITKDSKDGDITKSNILFDSQEATCFLLYNKNKNNESAHCCKGLKVGNCYHNHMGYKKILPKKPLITEKEKSYLEKIEWEFSGRQCRECPECSPTQIIRRMPILMPEIITGNHKNRTIESIANELIFMEKRFVNILMKNPYVQQKAKKYGEIRQLPFGTISNVKVPVKPTHHLKEYRFRNRDYTDYLGSYHLTFTLPTTKNCSNRKFIELHQNFANQFQWIEPLLITAFFSSDPNESVSPSKKIRGSFRIMATGWGNIAGSDLRKLSKGKGIGRYANLETEWRKGLKFQETNELMRINELVRQDEPGAVGILSSDVRTFGFDKSHKCKGSECPKVSGAPMVKPNGIELRIFDHFNSRHLIDLMRIMVYLAENSRKNPCKGYVYKNKEWISMTQNVMENGWRAVVSKEYIKELNKNLGLDLELKRRKAFGLLLELNQKIFLKNKDGLIAKLMIGKKYHNEPNIPQINRFSWQIRFNAEYGKKIREFIKLKLPKKEISYKEFEKIFFQTFNKKMWKNNIIDVLYAMESSPNNLIELKLNEGVIISITKI